eukprot:jgi/Undpi1/13827/HiC_scaffold_9.g03478.m1
MHQILSRGSYRCAVRALNGGAAATGTQSKVLASLAKLSVGGRRSVYTWKVTPTLTKIVATIGPVSEDFEPLQQVVDAGMRVMRINFSHATFEEAEKRLTNLRACKGKHSKACLGEHNLRAVLLDTQGPEIRTGNVQGGGKIELVQGSTMELTTNPEHREEGTAEKLFISYPGLTGAVNVGSAILLDDGQVSLRVTDVREESVTCLVENRQVSRRRREIRRGEMVVAVASRRGGLRRREVAVAVLMAADFAHRVCLALPCLALSCAPALENMGRIIL